MRQKKVAREKEMEKPENERKEKKEAQGPGRKAGDRKIKHMGWVINEVTRKGGEKWGESE